MDKKILYVDISLKGHRIGYLNALLSIKSNNISLIPHESNDIIGKTIIDTSGFSTKRNLRNYIKFINQINKLIKAEKVDIVHFLCGDALYRFFGLFLKKISCPIIITYHHVQFNKVRNYSLNMLYKSSEFGVVHTSALKKSIEDIGIKNVYQIEYPVFNEEIQEDMLESRKYFDLPEDKKIFAVMGATSHYKGLDILLEALKKVDQPFYLFIAGKLHDFNKEYIDSKTNSYKNNVKCTQDRLSDTEFAKAINAADYIVLPYRKEFDGASGPLAEGAWYRKNIIGSEHGSLGSLIQKNSLGITFRTEDITDLTDKINVVLKKGLFWNEKAESYREQLTIESFLNSYKLLYKQVYEYCEE